jgi:acyl-CoA thioester hydrolase
MAERLGAQFGVNLTDPGTFEFWYEDRVRFADLDPQGHVGHVDYGHLFQSARLAFWPGVGLAENVALTGLLVARMCIEYLGELTYPGTVRTGTRLLAIGRTSVTAGSGMFDGAGKCVATTEVVSVRYDEATGKPITWPEEVRARLGPSR